MTEIPLMNGQENIDLTQLMTGKELLLSLPGKESEVDTSGIRFVDVSRSYGNEEGPVLAMTIETPPSTTEVLPRTILPGGLLDALEGVTCSVDEVVNDSNGRQWAVVKLVGLIDVLLHESPDNDIPKMQAAFWLGGHVTAAMAANPHFKSRGGPVIDILLADGRTVHEAA